MNHNFKQDNENHSTILNFLIECLLALSFRPIGSNLIANLKLHSKLDSLLCLKKNWHVMGYY